jgi:hypothetical protein
MKMHIKPSSCVTRQPEKPMARTVLPLHCRSHVRPPHGCLIQTTTASAAHARFTWPAAYWRPEAYGFLVIQMCTCKSENTSLISIEGENMRRGTRKKDKLRKNRRKRKDKTKN